MAFCLGVDGGAGDGHCESGCPCSLGEVARSFAHKKTRFWGMAGAVFVCKIWIKVWRRDVGACLRRMARPEVRAESAVMRNAGTVPLAARCACSAAALR